jgi:hypothetical protein
MRTDTGGRAAYTTAKHQGRALRDASQKGEKEGY